MIRLRTALLAALAFAAAPTQATAPPPALRIATLGPRTAPCGPLSTDAPPGEQAYFALLAHRMEMRVLNCPMASREDAARAIAGNTADLAVLDAQAYRPVAAKTRSILTVRPDGEFARIPAVVAVRADDPRHDLADLRGATAVLGGSNRSYSERPMKALADQGATDGYFSAVTRAGSADEALDMLRKGKVDAMILHAGAWRRVCLKVRGKSRCDELRVAWRGRPRAQLAVVAPNSMSLETRYRLIGIHLAMHQEAPAAFQWASSWIPNGAEFEPTESDALILTSSRGP